MTTLASDVTPKLRQYGLLMRLDKPIGTLLLLWPCLWALWIAGAGRPAPGVVLVFLLGAFLMRSAGCVINDFADRDIDPFVERTRERPLAARRVSAREALALFAVLCLAAFCLVLTQNRETILLSIPAVILAATYPYMKRVHSLPQAHLGAAFGWAVPMSFAALTGEVSALAWLLFAVAVLWAIAYDTSYAMVDREDDLRVGVKSSAILFGRFDRLAIGVAQALVVAGLYLIGHRLGLGWPFQLALLAGSGLFAYQQWLIRGRSREACFQAFLNNNWFGFSIFAGILGHYLV